MKRNLHKTDRIIRLISGIAMLVISISKNLNDSFISNIILSLGIYLIFTSVINLCPIYLFLDIDTNKKKRKMY